MSEIDWDFTSLEKLIQDRGDELIHEIGAACTCRAEDPYASTLYQENRPAGRRRLNCEACNGEGWIYRAPQLMKGLVTSVEAGRNRQLLEMGYVVPGDCTFSPSLNARQVQDFDKVTMLYAAPVNEGQIIMRNSANIGENAHLDLNLAQNEDRLWYTAECATWCEDEDGNTYTQGVDFNLENNRIIWTSSRPDDGKFYTLKYNAFLEWIVYATPMVRFDRDRKLGQRVLLRKKHVAQLNDYEFNTVKNRADQASAFTGDTTI